MSEPNFSYVLTVICVIGWFIETIICRRLMKLNRQMLSTIRDTDVHETDFVNIQTLRSDVERLNRMILDTGYGQGQIDAYAAQCEEVDRLRQQNADGKRLIAQAVKAYEDGDFFPLDWECEARELLLRE